MIETVAKDLYELPKKPVKGQGSNIYKSRRKIEWQVLSLKNVTKKIS